MTTPTPAREPHPQRCEQEETDFREYMIELIEAKTEVVIHKYERIGNCDP